jgi:hypothetical protein
MNRAIKFRAWDNTLKQWSRAFDMDNAGEVYPAATPHQGEIVIMQYTGLEDRHGREIYEGDIVLRHKVNGASSRKFRIKWIPREAGFDQLRSMDGKQTKSLEVIGNIYENPELLP